MPAQLAASSWTCKRPRYCLAGRAPEHDIHSCYNPRSYLLATWSTRPQQMVHLSVAEAGSCGRPSSPKASPGAKSCTISSGGCPHACICTCTVPHSQQRFHRLAPISFGQMYPCSQTGLPLAFLSLVCNQPGVRASAYNASIINGCSTYRASSSRTKQFYTCVSTQMAEWGSLESVVQVCKR